MLDKTLKTSIAAQAPVLQEMTRKDKAVAHRGATVKSPPAAKTDSDTSTTTTDKADAGAPLVGDNAELMARAPALEALQPPATPRKIKADSLRMDQRAVLRFEFLKLNKPGEAGAVGRMREGKTPLKEPSVLEFTGADGEPQRWFVSNTLRSGSFGKFRVAIADTANGRPERVMAIKEYRLEARAALEQTSPSATQRRKALKALLQIGRQYPGKMAKRAALMAQDLQKKQALSPKQYAEDIRYLETRANQDRRPIPENLLNALQLKPITSHSKEADIATENALFAEVGSPLRVQESVELNGRVYNFSELMRGEFFDVLCPAEHAGSGAHVRTLSETERRDVTRAVAREASAALLKMHDADVVHLDIKPENLFMDDHGNAQLGDWNFATHLDGKGQARGVKGTMNYLAPEMLSQKAYGKAVDIFSLGITLATTGTGTYLFEADPPKFVHDDRERIHSVGQAGLGHVIELLQFNDRGIVKQSLIDAEEKINSTPVPFPHPSHQAAVRRAAHEALAVIREWNAVDPGMCGPVLDLMLRRNPDDRASVRELHEMFSEMQPSDSPGAHNARAVTKNILAQTFNVDAEIDSLKAYGKAYNTEDSED